MTLSPGSVRCSCLAHPTNLVFRGSRVLLESEDCFKLAIASLTVPECPTGPTLLLLPAGGVKSLAGCVSEEFCPSAPQPAPQKQSAGPGAGTPHTDLLISNVDILVSRETVSGSECSSSPDVAVSIHCRASGGNFADVRQGAARAAGTCAHVGMGVDQERRDLEWPHCKCATFFLNGLSFLMVLSWCSTFLLMAYPSRLFGPPYRSASHPLDCEEVYSDLMYEMAAWDCSLF